MAKIKQTILILEVNDKEWHLQYTGSIGFPQLRDKTNLKHDERIIRALISDRRLFELFQRLIEPAKRYYRRKDKKHIQS